MPETIFELHRGTAPLLLSMPHAGTVIPEALRGDYVPRALAVEDTDWHLPRLYAFAEALGASILVPKFSRYVIDLNRPPDDTPMYPGASNTELCPTRFFTGDALYRDGRAPDAEQVARRRTTYWQPYHATLADELQRIRTQHGYSLLWDAHSIRAEIPWLFDGTLPDLNLGTASGASCAPSLRAQLEKLLQQTSEFTYAVDGRFKGGYITRAYGRPSDNIHAVQLEMGQRTYMDETPPFAYSADKAARVQPCLQLMLGIMLSWRPQ